MGSDALEPIHKGAQPWRRRFTTETNTKKLELRADVAEVDFPRYKDAQPRD